MLRNTAGKGSGGNGNKDHRSFDRSSGLQIPNSGEYSTSDNGGGNFYMTYYSNIWINYPGATLDFLKPAK